MAETGIQTALDLQPGQKGYVGGRALRFNPALMPQVQRSQMLADMLARLQQHGGENLYSPWALGMNLLAEAILQKDVSKSTGEAEEGRSSGLAQGMESLMGGGGGAGADAATAAALAHPVDVSGIG